MLCKLLQEALYQFTLVMKNMHASRPIPWFIHKRTRHAVFQTQKIES